MKKTMLFAFGAALLCGCTEVADRAADAADSSCMSFPVAEARGVFEEALAARTNTRAADGPEEPGFFAPGEAEPVWDEAAEVPAGDYLRVDVPVVATHNFYRFVPREGTDFLDEAAIPRTLAVMKDPAGERRAVYFCLYIADAEFAEWCAGRPRQEWVDGKVKNGFTGVVLYTTLSGRIAAAGRYDYGRLEGSVFFGDFASNRDEALERFADLLGLTYVARGRAVPTTRGVNDDNQIEVVVILGPKVKEEDIFDDFDWEVELPPIGEGLRGGGGSSGGGTAAGSNGDNGDGTGGSTTSPCPKLQTKDPGVITILKELDKDCMGATLFRTLSPYVKMVSDANAGSRCRIGVKCDEKDGEIIHQEFVIELGTVLKDIAVFEEVIHVYQYTGRQNVPEDRLNVEIEAKLGWYMYRQRIGNVGDISRALGGDEGIIAFDKLSGYYGEKDFSSSGFYEAYNAAVSALRNIKAYSDDAEYMIDPNACNFPNLEKLMKDC